MRRRDFEDYCQDSGLNNNKYLDILFNKADLDQNGKVDFVEYFVLTQELNDDTNVGRLKLVFKMLDKDNNGKINKKELEQFLMMDIIGLTENKANIMITEIFRSFEKYENESLTEREFVNGCVEDEYFKNFFTK